MPYFLHSKNPIGCFHEKSGGAYHEYALNNEFEWGDVTHENFPHIIFTRDGFRFARVRKTVAYIVVGEDEYGNGVVEKWYLQNNRRYAPPS